MVIDTSDLKNLTHEELLNCKRAIKLALRRQNRQMTSANLKVETNWSMYALELEDGCYYVGISGDVEKRFKQHLGIIRSRGSTGKHVGSRWTRLHKPIRIIETIPIGIMKTSEAVKQENELTLSYIATYGYEYVRGGKYLTDYQLEKLRRKQAK